MSDQSNLEIIVVCWNKDKIKFDGVYVPVTADVFDEYVAAALKEGKQISHGICHECAKVARKEIHYNRFIQIPKEFIRKSKEYFGV